MADFESMADEAHFENTEIVPRETYVPNKTRLKDLPGDLISVTNEDREIDQMLEQQAKRNPIQDMGHETMLVREPTKRDILRNYVKDYKPASSISELDDQVFQASNNDIDSIEATPALVRYFCKREFDYIKDNVGYFIYHNIRVYIDGFFEKNKDADRLTIEQKMHGGSKLDIGPIITPQKI